MPQYNFRLEVNDSQVILNPQHHEYTLLWIHGLNQTSEKHLAHLLTQPLINTLKNFRVVIPRAPKRYVTLTGQEMASWFDVKFRNQKSFTVDFDEAFSSAEVWDSYQRVLKPLIQRQDKLLGKSKRLFVGGFSQGCGMSLHCFYETKIQFAGVIGVSGYLFPITNFDKSNKTPKRIIHGSADIPRAWEYVKVTYEGKVDPEDIVLVQGVGHEIKPSTIQEISKFIEQVVGSP